MNIAIIGAGASGLFLASYLNKNTDYKVTIFEKNSCIGKKILASGNGRGNFANIYADKSGYNNPKFMDTVFKKVSVFDILEYFYKLGLLYYNDIEGRVYPYSETSISLLEVLKNSLNNTTIHTNSCIKSIKYNDGFYLNNYIEKYDYLVVASGSYAGVSKNKSLYTYDYLDSLDIPLTKLKSSLVGFKTKDLSAISGLRAKALVKLYVNNQLIHEENGEVIFKDSGISGIVIMNMSCYYARINNPKNAYLKLDLLPTLDADIVKEHQNKHKFIGLVHPKIRKYLFENEINLKEFRLDIIDTYDSTLSQTISGGINLNIIDEDMRYKANKKIYCIGEALDIDGICGGYNLLFAFQSAMIAAKDIIKNEARD